MLLLSIQEVVVSAGCIWQTSGFNYSINSRADLTGSSLVAVQSLYMPSQFVS